MTNNNHRTSGIRPTTATAGQQAQAGRRRSLGFGLAAVMLTTFSVGALVVPQVAEAQVFVQVAPPAPRVERVPAPRRGYVWAPGHWEWRNHRYVWAGGTWVRERRGYRYRAPTWVEHNGRWEQRRGGWDRDGDGIPNRYDRHPNNGARG